MVDDSLKSLDVHEEFLTPKQEDRLLDIEKLEAELIAGGRFEAELLECETFLAELEDGPQSCAA